MEFAHGQCAHFLGEAAEFEVEAKTERGNVELGPLTKFLHAVVDLKNDVDESMRRACKCG